MDERDRQELERRLGLVGQVDGHGNERALCPFHDDTNPSLSVNLDKGLAYCFTCGEGWKLETVLGKLQEEGDGEEVEDGAGGGGEEVEVHVPVPTVRGADLQREGEHAGAVPTVLPPGTAPDLGAEIQRRVEQLWIDRRLPPEVRALVEWEVGVDPTTDTYGYLVFREPGRTVARRMLDELGRVDKVRFPRFRTSSAGGIFWVRPPEERQVVILTEGILDALAVAATEVDAGIGAALGTGGFTEGALFGLRKQPVVILPDADHHGWKAGRAAQKALLELEGMPTVLELPAGLGKDPGEAWAQHPERFRGWLLHQLTTRELLGSRSLLDLWTQEPPAKLISTGITGWDRLMAGGFRVGVHVVGAEPGHGKSAYALYWSAKAAEAGHRVLYATYEIPPRQCWARVASIWDPMTWVKLEADNRLMSTATRARLEKLTEKLRVVSGWSLSRIEYAASDYDVIVVDYLQRVPTFGDDSFRRLSLERNVSRLSDLARDQGKVVLLVSSLNREGYETLSLRSLRESGVIEYVAQSVMLFSRSEGGQIACQIFKNTRGLPGTFWMNSDLGHTRFSSFSPPVPVEKVAEGWDE